MTPAAPGVSAAQSGPGIPFAALDADVRVSTTTERATDAQLRGKAGDDDEGDEGVITLDYPGIDSGDDFGEEHR